MGFIRIKKIKGHSYAYLSENQWMKRKGKVRQKTKKYLGKVVRLEIKNNKELYDFINIPQDIEHINQYIKSKERDEIFSDLIKWELKRHDFKEVRNVFRKDDLYVNIRLKQVMKDKQNIVLSINEGYLCGHTMSRLFKFKAYSIDDSLKLAKYIVEAGIKIPEEIFIGIFSKYNIALENQENEENESEKEYKTEYEISFLK